MSALYTPAMLAAAVELADYPAIATPDCEGRARSETCGSQLSVQFNLDGEGRIAALGLQVKACAVGQASAAVFARHAIGKGEGEIETTYRALKDWLKGEGPEPDWPDLDLIAPAIAYPARHAAMLLPWKAALGALSSVPASR